MRLAKALNKGSIETEILATSSSSKMKTFGLRVKEFFKKIVNFENKKVMRNMNGCLDEILMHLGGLFEENIPMRMRCNSIEIFMINLCQTV